MFSITPLCLEAARKRLGERLDEGGSKALGELDSEIQSFEARGCKMEGFGLECCGGDEGFCFFLFAFKGEFRGIGEISESSPGSHSESNLDSELTILSPFSDDVMSRALEESEGLGGITRVGSGVRYNNLLVSFRQLGSLGLVGGDCEICRDETSGEASEMGEMSEAAEVAFALSEGLRHILWHYEASLEAKFSESRG